MSDEMFRDPDQGDFFKPRDWAQHLLLIEPQRFLENISTQNGMKDAVEARVHVLSAPGGAEVFNSARLFGQFETATRDAIGSGVPVIGRVAQFVSRSGGPAFRLDASSPEDKQYAAGYWQTWKAQHPAVQGPPASSYGQPQPAPLPQPQGYGQPSEQDRQWATQQQYAPPTVTTSYPQMGSPTPQTSAQAPAPAPQQPAAAQVAPPPPVPAPAPAPSPQPAAQAQSASVLELTAEQLEQMPEETKKLLLGAAYQPPAGS